MPICKREGFEDFTKNPRQDTFQDHDQVFYCETTKQIFRDYEEYFRHVMVINSTIWQCEATKREHLTYAEALKSERRARKRMELFKDCLRPIVLLLVEKAQQASLKTLCRLAYTFIRARFFMNEEVEAVNNSSVFHKYLVIGIIPKSIPESGVYDPTKVAYKVRKIGGALNGKEYLIPHENIRRLRNEFCHENLQMFIQDNVIRIDGILHVKPESYKKYITERKANFSKMFLGKMPHYEPSKPKKSGDDVEKKQSTMSKYLTKTNEITAEQEAARQERAKSLREEMERLRKQEEEKQAEIERKKAERLAMIDEQAKALVKKTDDLERYDQKPLPKYQTITTQIPVEHFGDCITVLEFMHSFASIMSGLMSAFRPNLSFYELTRAITVREVAGPLSDIIRVLLGTIFELQQEEEMECAVKYAPVRIKEREPYITMAKATKTQDYVRRHFATKLYELPLDAQTISETLRLHLLASGSQVNEKTERWRVMYRNGYYSNEDPGLQLRMSHPQLLKFLSVYTVYQLPMPYIFQVINTLIAQILTYSSPLNTIERRMEETAKSKMELRILLTDENRRLAHMEFERKRISTNYDQLIKEQPDQAVQLGEKMNKELADLTALSAREKKKFDNKLENLHSQLFCHMIFLGTDRAYRKYYVLESIPGVFVEHSTECYETCLENPPKNVPQFVGCPRTLKELRTHLSRIYRDEDDQNQKKRKSQTSITTVTAEAQDNKENKENEVVLNGEVKLNGDASKVEANGEVEPMDQVESIEPVEPSPPTQYQLMMCTGDPKNCIVHDPDNPDRQAWAFFHTEEELDELIKSLNPLGERESALLKQLRTMRTMIVNHIKRCPIELLSSGDKGTSNFARFRSTLKEKTRKRYTAANYGFPENCDLNSVMYTMLLDRVLQMEIDITTGDLGRLKVDDIEKWRGDLQNDTFDPQREELVWGESADSKVYHDPGQGLEEEPAGKQDEIKCVDNLEPELCQRRVKDLATALLQIEQGIEQRFLQEPFGVKKETKDKEKMEQLLEAGRERIRRWELSLMHSTSYSQIFLHLHFLNNAIKWQRSTNKSCCQICRLMTDPEKMLLCDECNAGTHMYCMKPKLKTVPEGNWYCKRCVSYLGLKNNNDEPPKKKPRKRAFLLDEEDMASEGSSFNSRSNGRRRSKHMRMEEIENELCNSDVDEENESRERDDEEEDEDVEANTEDVDGNNDVDDVDDDEQCNDDDIDDVNRDDDDDEDDEEEDEEENEEEADDEVDRQVVSIARSSSSANDEPGIDNVTENGNLTDDDDEICVVCSYNGGEIACTSCKSVYHLDCAELRRTPRSNWICNSCKGISSRKRKSVQNDDSTEDEDYDQPLVKRGRPSTSSNKRSSTRTSINDNYTGADEIIRTNNNIARRSRRANDNLPLNSLILYDLLTDIMKHDSSWPFLRPVSHSEVPDYHTIIKEPMDFAKVKSKLNMGKYTINEELLKDIELIFKNCDIYNQEGNEIYVAGSTLERFVMERCKELNLPFNPSDMNR